MDELELSARVAAARGGDEVAIGVLFRALQPRLLRFLAAREARSADDLAAEVWLGLATALPSFSGGWPEFRALAFTIARRRVVDHRRTGVRRPSDPTADDRILERPTDDRGGPEDQAVARDRADDAVRLIVAHLPPDQAEVVLLRVVGGLDVDEVAAVMDRSANWVRVNQHRAVRRLADRLGSELDVMR